MCIVELNVSLLPCRHRWYHLQKSCTPVANLANCGSKLCLSGWEIKCDFCPYCAGWNLSTSEYRLVGNDRAPSVGGLSRTPSLSLSTTRRESRRGSLSRTDSSNSIMTMAQEKNRAMNARVEAYFRVPETPALAEADDEAADMAATTSPSDTASEGHESLRHAPVTMYQSDKPSLMKKMRRQSKRLSLNLFK